MAFNPRNLLLFAGLVTAAILTGVFARFAEEPEIDSSENLPLTAGYYLKQATLHGTDDLGRRFYSIHADLIEQQVESSDFEFEEMSVEYTPETDVRWDIHATQGLTGADREYLELSDDVRLTYAPDSVREEFVFETKQLDLYANEFLAKSDETVEMYRGKTSLRSIGLEVNLKTDAWKLGATTLLAVASSSSSGQSREGTVESIQGACQTLSGNLRSDEEICVGFEFNDGVHRVSAGLATTTNYDFQSSLWTLSDGVRFAFDTAEISGEAAKIEFEEDEPILAEFVGNPVVMSDFIEERSIAVRGTAESISFDSRSGILRLLGRTTLVVGENEYSACNWTYNVNDKTYDAGADDGDCQIVFRLSAPEESNGPQAQPAAP